MLGDVYRLLTFVATPGTLICYPAHVRRPAVSSLPASSPHGHPPSTITSSSDKGSEGIDDKSGSQDHVGGGSEQTRKRFTVVLDKLESLGALFVFTNLFAAGPSTPSSETTEGVTPAPARSTSSISFNPLRLIELTERLSGVLLASDAAAEHLKSDPLTLLYRTFASVSCRGGSGGITVQNGEFAVTQTDNFADTVKDRADRDGSQMIVVPWTLNQDKVEQESVIASYREFRIFICTTPSAEWDVNLITVPNPFGYLFGNKDSAQPGAATQPDSSLYASFLRDLFASSSCDVGLFFDRGLVDGTSSSAGLLPSTSSSSTTNVFLPFFGGSDDRACLEIAIQLAKRSPKISVTVVAIQRAPEETEEDRSALNDDSSSSSMIKANSDETNTSTLLHGTGGAALQLTVAGGTHQGGGVNARHSETLYPTQHGLASETEDDLVLERAKALPSSTLLGTFEIIQVSTVSPLKTMIRRAASLSTSSSDRLVFLLGRSRRDASSHRVESLALLKQAERDGSLGICASHEVRKCVGEAASAALISEVGENVWVVQSGKTGGKRATKAFKGGEA